MLVEGLAEHYIPEVEEQIEKEGIAILLVESEFADIQLPRSPKGFSMKFVDYYHPRTPEGDPTVVKVYCAYRPKETKVRILDVNLQRDPVRLDDLNRLHDLREAGWGIRRAGNKAIAFKPISGRATVSSVSA